ncbi:MAG TPA: hypothetical protein VI146_03575 [Nitrososphaeraceae archaeon]
MNPSSLNEEPKLLYLRKYLHGRANMFTAHLMHMLSKLWHNNTVQSAGKRSETKLDDFG